MHIFVLKRTCLGYIRNNLTIISIGLQREVPQYMAMPWFITWVIALTVSVSQNNSMLCKCYIHSLVLID